MQCKRRVGKAKHEQGGTRNQCSYLPIILKNIVCIFLKDLVNSKVRQLLIGQTV